MLRYLFVYCVLPIVEIRVITKLPISEQSYKGKVKTHKYIKRQNKLKRPIVSQVMLVLGVIMSNVQ